MTKIPTWKLLIKGGWCPYRLPNEFQKFALKTHPFLTVNKNENKTYFHFCFCRISVPYGQQIWFHFCANRTSTKMMPQKWLAPKVTSTLVYPIKNPLYSYFPLLHLTWNVPHQKWRTKEPPTSPFWLHLIGRVLFCMTQCDSKSILFVFTIKHGGETFYKNISSAPCRALPKPINDVYICDLWMLCGACELLW